MNTKIRKSGLLSMATFCWLSCWSSLLYADTAKVLKGEFEPFAVFG